MPSIRHRLEQSLILLDDYLHPLFGADRTTTSAFSDLKNKLGEFPDGYDSNGRSFLAQRLKTLYQGDPSELETYDDNIKRHLDAINARRPQDEQIVLKYFQHLSLLYTEHILRRVFTDTDAFIEELNELVARRNQRERNDKFDDFTPNDLTKLAYWMATGSGKTLLMHLNYHQIRHYLAQAKQPPYENILLITPNAGLSQQHLAEFALSDIPAQIFRQGSRNLPEGVVQIIEITKFTTGSSGPQTVNVGHFEGHNLIFVDEGHRGSSGDVWLGYRDKLAADGFTFEYSATFGEALNSGNKATDLQTRHAYGKSIAFDYSYRYFYSDGYGKDYSVLNLPESYHENDSDVLLLASLLTFFEQTWVYQEHNEQVRNYFIEKPLLMFVGHTVQAGKKKNDLTVEDKATISDVLDIVRFLHRVVKDPRWSVGTIQRIIDGRSGIKEAGVDIFRDNFRVIKGNFDAALAYRTLLETVFHTSAPGPIHLSNLSNAAGEISLRVGTTDTPFGIINIGDDLNFLTATERANLGLVIDPVDAFRGSLFETINYTESKVNILVGAKKFTEGWNSWRVSGMGLLNVGKSEGSEVIQMFGRGVRLRGYQRSLKRSSVLDGNHPLHLPLLETLHIFSIKGNYLKTFRDSLEREGIPEGYEEVYLPVRLGAFEQISAKLYVLRPRGDLQFADQPTFALKAVRDPKIKPTLDRISRVQVATSFQQAETLRAGDREANTISPHYLALLDWEAIYREMLTWRRERNFQNMAISREVLREIVEPNNGQAQYYVLYAPEEQIKPGRFSDIYHLQVIVVDILKQYAERFYNRQRQRWESEILEYRLLDKNDPNLNPSILPLDPPRPGYVIKINRKKPELVDALETLLKQGDKLYQQDHTDFPSIVFDRHLYTPLIAQGYYNGVWAPVSTEDIKSVPVGLNEGETRFVWRLRQYIRGQGSNSLGGCALYLLRNLSRGKGVGFFEASNFYPDFILWLVADKKQVLTFIDPKGLRNLSPNDFSHPKIQLFKTLKDKIAPRLDKPNVILDSYIISHMEYEETSSYFGDSLNPYDKSKFLDHHVLFPGTAAPDLLESLLKQL